MKKAKLVLVILIMSGLLGGLFAFKVRYNGWEALKTTYSITITVGGMAYATSSTTPKFCTTMNRWVTTFGVQKTSIWTADYDLPPIGNTVLTATNGSGFNIIVVLYPCYNILTYTTLLD
jgi:hypothetical protein